MNKRSLGVFIALMLPLIASAQKSYENRNITMGRIIFSNNSILDGYNINIAGDSLEFYEPDLRTRHLHQLSEIQEVREAKGNWATTGTWIGTLVGTGLGVVAAVGMKHTETTSNRYFYTETTTVPTWPIYVFAMAGAGIGYLIGSNTHDWRTAYDKDMALLKSIEIRADRGMRCLSMTYRIPIN